MQNWDLATRGKSDKRETTRGIKSGKKHDQNILCGWGRNFSLKKGGLTQTAKGWGKNKRCTMDGSVGNHEET